MGKILLVMLFFFSMQNTVLSEKNVVNRYVTRIAFKLVSYCKQYDGFLKGYIPVFDGKHWYCVGPYDTLYSIKKGTVDKTCKEILNNNTAEFYLPNGCNLNWSDE